MLKVCLITATKGRHKQLERVVRFSLEQTYDNWVHLIYNNSPVELQLDDILPADKYILINNHKDLITKQDYKTLGDIYRDIMTFLPDDIDVINFMDDDDVFLPNHVEEGVKGLIRGKKKAYKPKKSWYRHGRKNELVENTLEPSIFVYADHIREFGFSSETTAQHLQWVNPLVYHKEIFVDPEGKPTYICDWSQQIPTFKTSGDPHNPSNFDNYTSNSQDHGDNIISPCSKEIGEKSRRTKVKWYL